jgi:hypothetical protein
VHVQLIVFFFFFLLARSCLSIVLSVRERGHMFHIQLRAHYSSRNKKKKNTEKITDQQRLPNRGPQNGSRCLRHSLCCCIFIHGKHFRP